MPTDFKLTVPQSKFFSSTAKATAMVAGFGAGKSEALFVRMLATKLNNPKSILAYYAPTYGLVKDIFYPRIEEMLDRTNLSWKLNKADNNILIKGYGRIIARSMEIPSKIIGYETMHSFIDELDTLPTSQAEEVWIKVIARNRQKIPGTTNQMFVATTPEGYKFVYNKFKKNPPPGYALIKAPTSSNPYLPEDYVQTLRDSYPANLIDAYLNGEFVNLKGNTVYSQFDRKLNHSPRTMQQNDELFVGIDFNVGNMNATIHIKDKDRDYNPVAVAEITSLADTPTLIKQLQEYRYSGYSMYLYPDASGKSRKTVDASLSDLQLLTDAGFTLRVPHGNPPVKDRIVSMNSMFCNGSNERRYLVNTDACPDYTNALEQQIYGANMQPEKDRSNNIDDLNDGAGYFVHYDYAIVRKQFSPAFIRSY